MLFLLIAYSLQAVYEISDDLKVLTISGDDKITQKGARSKGIHTEITSVIIKENITGIGESSFAEFELLVNVIIPSTCLVISQCSFKSCTSLTEIEFPEGVQIIENEALRYCSKLVKVIFPSTLSLIYTQFCFHEDRCLVTFVVNNNPNFAVISGLLVKDLTLVVASPPGLTSITIPKGIETMGAYSCSHRTNLQTVTFSSDSTLKTFEQGCFFGDSGITSIILPKSLVTIKSNALGSTSLTTIHLPASLQNVDDNLFSEIPLQTVTYDEGCTAIKEINGTIYNASQTAILFIPKEATSITIPHNVKSIPSGILQNHHNLLSIEAHGHDKFQSYDGGLYEDNFTSFVICPGGKKIIELHQNCHTLCSYSFRYCYIEHVTCLSFIKKIEKSVFEHSKLKSINGLDFVEKLGGFVFSQISTPNFSFTFLNLSYITGYMFTGFHGLLSLNMEQCVNLKKIPTRAFSSCLNLKTLILPPNIHTISESSFESCVALTSLSIPSKVKIINMNAFRNCKKLQELIFEENSELETISDFSFSLCNISKLHFPLKSIGTEAFSENNNLNEILFLTDSQLNEVSGKSFANCGNVTAIFIPKTTTSIAAAAFAYMSQLKIFNVSKENSEYRSNKGILTDFEERTVICCAGGLSSALIGGEITAFGPSSFMGCSSLQNITFGDDIKLETIGSSTFSGCVSLKEFEVPASVRSISSSAFQSCTKLRGFRFQDGSKIEEIPSGLFSHAVNLERVVFGVNCSLKTISSGAFSNLKKLHNVVLPYGLQSLGSSSFESCVSLTFFELPMTVKKIESKCFAKCTSLKIFSFCGTSIECGDAIFSGCPTTLLIRVQYSFKESTISGRFVLHSLDSDCQIATVAFTASGEQCAKVTGIFLQSSLCSGWDSR